MPAVNATPAAPAITPAAPPLTSAQSKVEIIAYLVQRLTAASGGALPDGSARWVSRIGGYREAPSITHRPSGAVLTVKLRFDSHPVDPILLTMQASDAGQDKNLTIRVSRNGDGRFDRLAVAASACAMRVQEHREAERLMAARRQARLLTLREGFRAYVASVGLPVESATEVRAFTAEDPSPALPSFKWKVKITNDDYVVVGFNVQPDYRALDPNNATTYDWAGAIVEAGFRYTSWDNADARRMPIVEAVRVVKAGLAAAAVLKDLTLRETQTPDAAEAH